jgi:hypothetical protein
MAKKQKLETLEIQKQLLLAESELNRVELANDMNHFRREFDRIKKQTVVVGSIVSSLGLLATAASLFRRRVTKTNVNGSKPHMPKAPWLATALEGARVGASIIMKIRSIMRERDRDRR